MTKFFLNWEKSTERRRADRSMSEEEFSQHCADELEEIILAEGPDAIAVFIGELALGPAVLFCHPRATGRKSRPF